MIINIDTEQKKLTFKDSKKIKKKYSLFNYLSYNILKSFWEEYSWHFKYTYQFSWLGFPIIQLPDDIIQIQEFLFKEKPDFIVETGVAHGGSIIFYSSICKLLKKGKVIGIDIKIRKKNRKLLENSNLKKYFQLIESSSTSLKTILQIKNIIRNKKTFVILDSNHTCEHVYKELKLYGDILKKGSVILITDGIVDTMKFSPRRLIYNREGGPLIALNKFLKNNNKFKRIKPTYIFNKSYKTKDLKISHFPSGWIIKK